MAQNQTLQQLLNQLYGSTDLSNTPSGSGNAFQNAEEFNNSLITDPTLAPGSVYSPVMQTPNIQELMQGENVDPDALDQDAAQADVPEGFDPATYDPTQIGNNTPQSEAAQGEVSDDALVDPAQQAEGSEAWQQAVSEARSAYEDAEVDPRSTVQGQFKELMDYEPGETPAWMKGALREAEARLASRGIGASSMAGEALSMAAVRAAMPIAQQDAKVFQTMQLKKLDNKAKAAFLKAGHLANLDLANLNNRQQAAVMNAQAFMQMDMANLNNRQQTAIVNAQARLQSMLSDQAASNAAKQFNAQSENQVNEFFANLQSQIETFNTAQTNSMSQFNAEMENAREQFNVKNGLLVEQANVEYLRRINTQNTSMKNQANLVNSQNLLEISNTALANAFTLLRDRESYIFEAAENQKDRSLARALQQMKEDYNMEVLDAEQEADMASAVGSFAANVLGSWLS